MKPYRAQLFLPFSFKRNIRRCFLITGLMFVGTSVTELCSQTSRGGSSNALSPNTQISGGGSANLSDTIREKIKLLSRKDSFAYALGANTGRILKNYNVKELNWEIFKTSIEYIMQNGDSNLLMNKELEREVAMNYLTESKYGEERRKGEEFIAKMKKEGSYTVTPSGLLFKTVVKGTGVKPLITDTVYVHYTGKFIDGNTFDSSIGREPLKTAMNGGAVKGFLEALGMMDVGSKAEVILPYDLAYGKQGMQNPYTGEMMMEPYQTLIFEIELVSIKIGKVKNPFKR